MASLVADYGESSGSEESPEQTVTSTHKEKAQNVASKGTDFFGGDAGSESDSEEDEEDDASTPDPPPGANKLPNPFGVGRLPNTMALPSPALAGPGSSSDITGRVFLTQYNIAEANRNTVLEQHVKMTKVDPIQRSRKVCFNFRKGMCRYGKKCKYSHGDPVPLVPPTDDKEGDASSENDFSYYGNQHGVTQDSAQRGKSGNDEDSYMEEAKAKKKRPGVTNTVKPAKKAKKFLDSERAEERPWTKST